MAVTVHFCSKTDDQKLELHSRLGAFRHIPGRHTGANMAMQFLTILEELGVLHKVSFTMPHLYRIYLQQTGC